MDSFVFLQFQAIVPNFPLHGVLAVVGYEGGKGKACV